MASHNNEAAQPALGTCYYPEHWPQEQWAHDAANMVAAGIAWVRVAEFAWSRIEPERNRLFGIIEELVKWENSTKDDVLKRARDEIAKSWEGALPPIHDPFSGGGSIPLEAQRLGLPASGSDLNPVAVMIGKAMIEIPPLFKDRKPAHPDGAEKTYYKNAEGLA